MQFLAKPGNKCTSRHKSNCQNCIPFDLVFFVFLCLCVCVCVCSIFTTYSVTLWLAPPHSTPLRWQSSPGNSGALYRKGCDQDLHRYTKVLEGKKTHNIRNSWNCVGNKQNNIKKKNWKKPWKIASLWEGDHLQLCLWINICVSVFANWIHNWNMLRLISMMESILVCWFDSVWTWMCECVYIPLGGGLMSVSPCWLELSDCPDSAQKQRQRGGRRERQMVRISFVC